MPITISAAITDRRLCATMRRSARHNPFRDGHTRVEAAIEPVRCTRAGLADRTPSALGRFKVEALTGDEKRGASDKKRELRVHRGGEPGRKRRQEPNEISTSVMPTIGAKQRIHTP